MSNRTSQPIKCRRAILMEPLEIFLCEVPQSEYNQSMHTILTYTNADLFLMCFSINDQDSFVNILSRWNPDVSHYAPTAQKLLVGTKRDLRSELTESQTLVDPMAAVKLADTLSTMGYLKCSVKYKEGLQEILDAIISWGSHNRKTLLDPHRDPDYVRKYRLSTNPPVSLTKNARS
jgi:GTPase SAR1 family protein